MPFSQDRSALKFTLWLRSQRQQQNAIGDLARFVEHDQFWPKWRDHQGLIYYLRADNALLLPHLHEAWQEYEKAIAKRRES